jgi:hypothetical protein
MTQEYRKGDDLAKDTITEEGRGKDRKILRKGVQEPGVGKMCAGVGHAVPYF